MPNYFDLFGLPASILLDETALKKQFYALSRTLHPDQSVQGSIEEVGLQSAKLNQAYEVLRHFDSRVRHWLEIQGMMPAEGTYKMSPGFLSEMMDFNEAIMELEIAFDPIEFERLSKAAREMQKEWKADFLQQVDEDQADSQKLVPAAQKYFFQNRYLLRILENLNKFANF